MQHIKYKEFSASDSAQLRNLSFVAGGNLRKSASNRRNNLRNKEGDILHHNFFVKLKNFCIDLQANTCQKETFYYLSRNLNLYKKMVDPIDYSLKYTDDTHAYHMLKMFIKNNIPFKYLKMYHYNQEVINNALKPTANV